MTDRRGAILRSILGSILGSAILFGVFGPSPASAQAFRTYRCADGTQFTALIGGDSRAHLQLDGKAVTLRKRFALAGARYTGSGVTLAINRAGLTKLRHAKRRATTCELA